MDLPPIDPEQSIKKTTSTWFSFRTNTCNIEISLIFANLVNSFKCIFPRVCSFCRNNMENSFVLVHCNVEVWSGSLDILIFNFRDSPHLILTSSMTWKYYAGSCHIQISLLVLHTPCHLFRATESRPLQEVQMSFCPSVCLSVIITINCCLWVDIIIKRLCRTLMTSDFLTPWLLDSMTQGKTPKHHLILIGQLLDHSFIISVFIPILELSSFYMD